jgi:hypothetical protein
VSGGIRDGSKGYVPIQRFDEEEAFISGPYDGDGRRKTPLGFQSLENEVETKHGKGLHGNGVYTRPSPESQHHMFNDKGRGESIGDLGEPNTSTTHTSGTSKALDKGRLERGPLSTPNVGDSVPVCGYHTSDSGDGESKLVYVEMEPDEIRPVWPAPLGKVCSGPGLEEHTQPLPDVGSTETSAMYIAFGAKGGHEVFGGHGGQLPGHPAPVPSQTDRGSLPGCPEVRRPLSGTTGISKAIGIDKDVIGSGWEERDPPEGLAFSAEEIELLLMGNTKVKWAMMSSGNNMNFKFDDVWVKERRTKCDLPLGSISESRINFKELMKRVNVEHHTKLQEVWTVIKDKWVWEEVRGDYKKVRIGNLRVEEVQKLNIFKTTDLKQRIGLIPLFKVEKGEGKSRLIGDCRELNSLVPSPPKFRLPNIRFILNEIIRGQYMAQVDARSYFYQFPLGKYAKRRFLSALKTKKNEGSRVQWQVMPMGFSWAPIIAQTTSTALLETVLSGRPEVAGMCWVDNFVIWGNSAESVNGALRALLELFRQVNLETKDPEWASQRQQVLGVEIDLASHQAYFTAEDRERVIARIKKSACTPRSLLRALGTLIWANETISPRPLCHLGEVWSVLSKGMREWQQSKQWDVVDARLRPYISLLQEEIVEEYASVMEVEECDYPKQNVVVFSDASNVGLGWVKGENWSRQRVPMELIGASIYIKELLALVQGAEVDARLITDNRAVMMAILKGHSSSPGGNLLLSRMVGKWEQGKGTYIAWIPSENNLADGPSRDSEPYQCMASMVKWERSKWVK